MYGWKVRALGLRHCVGLLTCSNSGSDSDSYSDSDSDSDSEMELEMLCLRGQRLPTRLSSLWGSAQCGVCAMSALSLDVHVKPMIASPLQQMLPQQQQQRQRQKWQWQLLWGNVFAVGKSAHENYKFRFSLAVSAPFIIFSLISLPLQCWEFAILTKVFRARKASKK